MPKKFDPSQIPARPNLIFEADLWSRGYPSVAGVDEAGRGALAGPVAAAAVILPPTSDIADMLSGVRDSKQMTAKQRELWAGRIRDLAVACAVGFASSVEIDDFGIITAVHLAIQRALEDLSTPPDFLMVDYLDLKGCSTPQLSLVKGDARSLSIAAASVLAKTARDEWMHLLDSELPGYGFSQHKGYGTTLHRRMIAKLGLSAQHRQSFRCRASSLEPVPPPE